MSAPVSVTTRRASKWSCDRAKVRPQSARAAICRQTMRSRIEPMKKIARSLRQHRELILNDFRAGKLISSGVVEGLYNPRFLLTNHRFQHRRHPSTGVLMLTTESYSDFKTTLDFDDCSCSRRLRTGASPKKIRLLVLSRSSIAVYGNATAARQVPKSDTRLAYLRTKQTHYNGPAPA
jgi:hypothetical protein